MIKQRALGFKGGKINVEIVISTHNGEDTIQGLLDTLNNQKLPALRGEFRISVYANNCTDKTENIVKRNKVRLISMDKQGKARVWNKATEEIDKDVIIFLDDDLLLKDKYTLNKLLKTIQSENYQIVSGDIEWLRSRSWLSNKIFDLYCKVTQKGKSYNLVGGIYAMRNNLNFKMPIDVINEDQWLEQRVGQSNMKKLFSAKACHRLPATPLDYFKYFARISAGTYQMKSRYNLKLPNRQKNLFRAVLNFIGRGIGYISYKTGWMSSEYSRYSLSNEKKT